MQTHPAIVVPANSASRAQASPLLLEDGVVSAPSQMLTSEAIGPNCAARANRGFIRRSTCYLAGRGQRQFLDLAPYSQLRDPHEVPLVASREQVMHVDNDRSCSTTCTPC